MGPARSLSIPRTTSGELIHRLLGKPLLVRALAVVLDHFQSFMPRNGLNLLGRAARFEQARGGVLAQPVERICAFRPVLLAVPDRAEAVVRERCASGPLNDAEADSRRPPLLQPTLNPFVDLSAGAVQFGLQGRVKRNPQFGAGLVLLYVDAAVDDVVPFHAQDICPPLPGVEGQEEGGAGHPLRRFLRVGPTKLREGRLSPGRPSIAIRFQRLDTRGGIGRQHFAAHPESEQGSHDAHRAIGLRWLLLERVAIILAAATDEAAAAGRSIGPYVFPGHDGEPITDIKRTWLASITSIAEGSDPALTEADWEADLDNGLVYRLDGADNRRQWTAPKITVVYAAGYLLPGEQGRTLPSEIERAAILLASAAYRARGRDSFVKVEETPGVLRTEYFFGTPGDGGLPPEVEGLLVPFRNVPIG